MEKSGLLEASDIQEILELLEIPSESESSTDEGICPNPEFIPAWSFGEKPDDSIYSSTAMIR